MTESIEALTTSALALALDAASLRQQAIAANIANADVAGYVPLSVNFEAQLDDARRAIGQTGRLDVDALSDVVPRLEFNGDLGAANLTPKVLLDVEVAHLAQNAVQYQALVKGLSKHYELLSLAVKDGKN